MYKIFCCVPNNKSSMVMEENGKIFAMDASMGRKVL
jgi:hypothetical protein